MRLVVRHAVVSAVLLWRRLFRAKSVFVLLLGASNVFSPANIRKAAEVAGVVGSHSHAVAVEEVRSCVEGCELLALVSEQEATIFLRIEIGLGWVLLWWRSSVSSMVTRSWIS